ncbi:MAG: DUF4265 domain-containing protein [bacterium]|nr:DUF4265 domain-containing protein [bacterium]
MGTRHACAGTHKKFVHIHLPITHLPGVELECVWAEPLDSGTFRIENFPFFHSEVRFGDVVAATRRGNAHAFTRIVEESPNGNTIIEYTGGHTTFQRLAAAVRSCGGMMEGASSGIAGVNAPPEAWPRVRAILDREVTAGTVKILDVQDPLTAD